MALQWDPRDRWDFKRPRWEVDILGRGKSRSQAWVKSLVQRGTQYSGAGTRRDVLQSRALGRGKKALEAKARWKLNFFPKERNNRSGVPRKFPWKQGGNGLKVGQG